MTGFSPGPGWREVPNPDGPPKGVHKIVESDAENYVLSVWVREAPVPLLPTEPGYYLTTKPDYGGGPVVVELLNSPAGRWVDAGDRQYLNAKQIEDMLPLVRLEPRAITAKAVLDRLAEITAPENILTGGAYHDIVREFGVES